MYDARNAQPRRSRRARTWFVALAATAVLVGAVALVLGHDGTDKTVGAAVEDFRREQAAAADARASAPSREAPASTSRPASAQPKQRPKASAAGNKDRPTKDAPSPAQAEQSGPRLSAAEAKTERSRATSSRQAAAPRSRPEPPAHPEVPPAGVYVYATEGQESIDMFGGRTHEYPEETTIRLVHGGCGYTTRWQPLEERFDEYEVCRTDTPHLARMTMYHEFFNRGDRRDFSCDEEAIVRRPEARVGDTWTWTCTSDGVTLTTRIEVLELRPFRVGERDVDAVRLALDSTLEGDMRGTRRADVWFGRRYGLELHGTYASEVDVDTPVGTSRYTEDVTRTLKDLAPRR